MGYTLSPTDASLLQFLSLEHTRDSLLGRQDSKAPLILPRLGRMILWYLAQSTTPMLLQCKAQSFAAGLVALPTNNMMLGVAFRNYTIPVS